MVGRRSAGTHAVPGDFGSRPVFWHGSVPHRCPTGPQGTTYRLPPAPDVLAGRWFLQSPSSPSPHSLHMPWPCLDAYGWAVAPLPGAARPGATVPLCSLRPARPRSPARSSPARAPMSPRPVAPRGAGARPCKQPPATRTGTRSALRTLLHCKGCGDPSPPWTGPGGVHTHRSGQQSHSRAVAARAREGAGGVGAGSWVLCVRD